MRRSNGAGPASKRCCKHWLTVAIELDLWRTFCGFRSSSFVQRRDAATPQRAGSWAARRTIIVGRINDALKNGVKRGGSVAAGGSFCAGCGRVGQGPVGKNWMTHMSRKGALCPRLYKLLNKITQTCTPGNESIFGFPTFAFVSAVLWATLRALSKVTRTMAQNARGKPHRRAAGAEILRFRCLRRVILR